MEATHGKYTVRILCNNEDEMVNVKVVAEVHEGQVDWDGWEIAQEKHDRECMMDGGIVYPCGSQATEWFEGWKTEVKV